MAASTIAENYVKYTRVTEYMTIGITRYIKWDTWYHTDALRAEYPSIILPNVSGMIYPEHPIFASNPFKFRADYNTRAEGAVATLHRTFCSVSEGELRTAGFTPQAAKLLTYYRVCFISNGCSSSMTTLATDIRSLVSLPVGISMSAPSIDDRAFKLASASWQMLLMTVLGAYVDADCTFSELTRTLCERTWIRAPWPKLLAEYDLEWSQIYMWLIKPFPPSALWLAVGHALLTGSIFGAPIYDTVEYSVDDRCAVPMISPWGPVAASGWWKHCQMHMAQHIAQGRTAMLDVIAELGDDAIPTYVTAWVQSTMPVYYDIIRIMLPVLWRTLRPMYMPSLSSRLYLDHLEDDDKLKTHARSFATTMVSQGFAQEHLMLLSYDLSDLQNAWLPHQMIMGVTAEGATPQTQVMSVAIVGGGPMAATFPQVPTTGAPLTPESSSPSATSSNVPVDDPPAVPLELAPSREQQIDDALAAARATLTFEKYTEHEFRTAMQSPLNSKHHNRFFRPELYAAKVYYDMVVEGQSVAPISLIPQGPATPSTQPDRQHRPRTEHHHSQSI